MGAAITAAIIGGGALLAGTKMSTSASGKAARTQVSSANEAARIGGLTADKQLAFQREEAARLRADSEIARRGNFDLSQVEDRNVGSRFNIGNQLTASGFNADAANQRGEFNANRGDTNARYGALANDRSNIRAMLGGPAWTPATFAAIDPLERVTAGVYTPEEAKYLPGYVPPNNA